MQGAETHSARSEHGGCSGKPQRAGLGPVGSDRDPESSLWLSGVYSSLQSFPRRIFLSHSSLLFLPDSPPHHPITQLDF